jgi:hypothetical protein
VQVPVLKLPAYDLYSHAENHEKEGRGEERGGKGGHRTRVKKGRERGVEERREGRREMEGGRREMEEGEKEGGIRENEGGGTSVPIQLVCNPSMTSIVSVISFKSPPSSNSVTNAPTFKVFAASVLFWK